MTDKSKRIRRLLKLKPGMNDAQIARKIGMPNLEGWARVAKEREDVRSEGPATGFFEDCDEIDQILECTCGGLFDVCAKCLARRDRG